jgi:glucosylceramidase
MIEIFTSSQSGKRWEKSILENNIKPSAFSIIIDPSITFQTHLGFGGAITESTAYTTYEGRSKDDVQKVINLYFSKEGLNYNLTRIHMNSSDFSLGNYTYVAYGDKDLKTFDMTRETLYTIPMIRQALDQQPDLKILVSPWSPPAWMKDNGTMNYGGKLLPEYRQTWANYFVKFIEGLKTFNIQPWGVSVQNEPAAKQVWDSCIYSAEEERDFVKWFLGPTLRKTFPDIKLLVWDHNRDIIIDRLKPIYEDKEASQYVWGAGFHWYGEEIFSNLEKVHQLDSSKHLLFTEGCIEGGPKPGSWQTGERYGRNIIEDFNHYNEGFIDWNLVLNEQGGPNHVGNYCDAPVLYHRQNKELILNSSYYVIGHFSKFIHPGSKRIHAIKALPKDIFATTYKLENGTIIVVLLNSSSQNEVISISMNNRTIQTHTEAHSIQTIVIDEKYTQ